MPKTMTAKVVVLGLTLLWVIGVACSQRVEPEEAWANRERERPLLPASAAPPALVTGAGSAANAGGRTGMAAPGAGTGQRTGMPEPGSPPDGTADLGPGISGRVEAPGLSAPPKGSILFVFVRPADRTSGPPLAVRRLSPAAFPVEFAIGPRDAMMAAVPFPEQITVEARLDGDGDPLTRGPGDRVAQVAPVAPGATGVRLVLEPAQ